MIRYFSEDTSFTPKRKRLISKWLGEVAAGRGYAMGELNYIFCSDPYLLEINRQFLGHDYYTDIITFDNSHGLLHLIGYDDGDAWHQQRMRAAENRALALYDKMRAGE